MTARCPVVRARTSGATGHGMWFGGEGEEKFINGKMGAHTYIIENRVHVAGNIHL